MISKVKVIEFALKVEPFVLIVASFASVEVLHTIYTALWATNKIDVIATGILFIGAVLSWWTDYFDKKKVEKLLDNF